MHHISSCQALPISHPSHFSHLNEAYCFCQLGFTRSGLSQREWHTRTVPELPSQILGMALSPQQWAGRLSGGLLMAASLLLSPTVAQTPDPVPVPSNLSPYCNSALDNIAPYVQPAYISYLRQNDGCFSFCQPSLDVGCESICSVGLDSFEGTCHGGSGSVYAVNGHVALVSGNVQDTTFYYCIATACTDGDVLLFQNSTQYSFCGGFSGAASLISTCSVKFLAQNAYTSPVDAAIIAGSIVALLAVGALGYCSVVTYKWKKAAAQNNLERKPMLGAGGSSAAAAGAGGPGQAAAGVRSSMASYQSRLRAYGSSGSSSGSGSGASPGSVQALSQSRRKERGGSRGGEDAGMGDEHGIALRVVVPSSEASKQSKEKSAKKPAVAAAPILMSIDASLLASKAGAAGASASAPPLAASALAPPAARAAGPPLAKQEQQETADQQREGSQSAAAAAAASSAASSSSSSSSSSTSSSKSKGKRKSSQKKQGAHSAALLGGLVEGTDSEEEEEELVENAGSGAAVMGKAAGPAQAAARGLQRPALDDGDKGSDNLSLA